MEKFYWAASINFCFIGRGVMTGSRRVLFSPPEFYWAMQIGARAAFSVVVPRWLHKLGARCSAGPYPVHRKRIFLSKKNIA
jgi:hypothetical protein